MKNSEATAEGFVAQLKTLPKSEQDAVIVHIAQDEAFRHDLLDLAIVAERKNEPSRPFEAYAGRSVVVPRAQWAQVLEDLEELDDIRAYDIAMSGPGAPLSFDQAVREIRELYGA